MVPKRGMKNDKSNLVAKESNKNTSSVYPFHMLEICGSPVSKSGGYGFPKPKIGVFAIPKVVNYQSSSLKNQSLSLSGFG